MIKLSDKAARIRQSEIRVMSVECERVRGINLAQGICDTEVPEPVRRGARDAIDAGLNQYTRLDGIAELRRALARKLARYNGITADPEREIFVTAGSTGGFYAACLALLDPGDEVIAFEPYYGYHVHTLEALGARPVYVRLEPPDWSFPLLCQDGSRSRRSLPSAAPAHPRRRHPRPLKKSTRVRHPRFLSEVHQRKIGPAHPGRTGCR